MAARHSHHIARSELGHQRYVCFCRVLFSRAGTMCGKAGIISSGMAQRGRWLSASIPSSLTIIDCTRLSIDGLTIRTSVRQQGRRDGCVNCEGGVWFVQKHFMAGLPQRSLAATRCNRTCNHIWKEFTLLIPFHKIMQFARVGESKGSRPGCHTWARVGSLHTPSRRNLGSFAPLQRSCMNICGTARGVCRDLPFSSVGKST